MIEIICGQKGKGKTKFLLEQANTAANTSNGFVVYLDKSSKHMYELNNKIRLIDITEYPVKSYDGFVGFVSGLLSGNHDIETVFFDSFLKIADLSTPADVVAAIATLDKIGGSNVKFVLSISLDKTELPEAVLDKITVSC